MSGTSRRVDRVLVSLSGRRDARPPRTYWLWFGPGPVDGKIDGDPMVVVPLKPVASPFFYYRYTQMELL